MTGKEVIKALECYSCMEDGLHEQALNLINRLKGDAIHYRRKAQNQKQELSRLNAEIERLKEELEIRNQKRVSIFEISNAYERGRANAIKEFAETYTENFIRILNLNCEQIEVARKVKDNLKSALLGICDDITEKGVSNND